MQIIASSSFLIASIVPIVIAGAVLREKGSRMIELAEILFFLSCSAIKSGAHDLKQ